MNRTLWIVLLTLAASASPAQVVRTFVSTSGSDTAACTRIDPCRNFGAALAAVSPGGEVLPLDSGGYGPVNVDKAVSIIVPPDIHAAIAPTSGNAVTVIASTSDSVVLRGLYLRRHGTAINGIAFVKGKNLAIENCQVSGFENGLILQRVAADDHPTVAIQDSTFRDGQTGVFLQQQGAGSDVHVTLNRCRLENNSASGLLARDRSRVTAHQTLASGNAFGFQFFVQVAGTSEGSLDHCVAAGNTIGIRSADGATVRISECTIAENGTGVAIITTGQVHTLENNLIAGNTTTNVLGTLTPLAPR